MNIWILNHYAITPDFPGGTRHFDFASELAGRGHSVTIFASSFHYLLFEEIKSYEKGKYIIENVRDNFDFVWVRTFSYRKNDWKRALNMLSYTWRAYKLIPGMVKNCKISGPDVIIGSTIHPFAALAALKLSRKYRVPFVFEIRDLWPQTMIDMGVWSENDLRSKFFKVFENKLVRNAKAIIALSPLTRNYLWEKYSYKEVFYIPNGVRIEAFLKPQNINLGDVFFEVIYAGGIDKVHGLGQLIKAAEILRERKIDAIKIKIFGEGKMKIEYMAETKNRGLDNIEWLSPIKQRKIPGILLQADTLFLSTAKVLYGSENKLFDYLAARKPIIVAAYAKHNNPIERLNCGISVPPDDPKALAEAIVKLYNMPNKEKEAMGKRGRKYVEKYHGIPVLVDKLEAVIKEVCGKEDNANQKK